MPHLFDIVVRWSDEDRLSHINNSRYHTFTEDARLSWLAGSPRGNAAVILARTEIDFLRPMHFMAGGQLRVLTTVAQVGRSSLQLRQDILDVANEPVARSRHVLVGYDYDRQQARAWDDDERAWLAGWTIGEAV